MTTTTTIPIISTSSSSSSSLENPQDSTTTTSVAMNSSDASPAPTTRSGSSKTLLASATTSFWRHSPLKSLTSKTLIPTTSLESSSQINENSFVNPSSGNRNNQSSSGTLEPTFTGAGSTETGILRVGSLVLGITNASNNKTTPSVSTRTSLGQLFRPSFSKKFLILTNQALIVKTKPNSPSYLGRYKLPPLSLAHETDSESFVAVFAEDAEDEQQSKQRANIAFKTANLDEALLWMNLLNHQPEKSEIGEEVSAIYSEAASMTMVQEATTIVSPTDAERLLEIARKEEEEEREKSVTMVSDETTVKIEEAEETVLVDPMMDQVRTDASMVRAPLPIVAQPKQSWLFSLCCTAE